MTNNIDKQSFGRGGAQIKTAAAFDSGNYCALSCVTDVTLTSLTGSLLDGTVTGITYPAGFTLLTPFTGCTLASGTAIAYKAVS
jgi:hypothetical protein